jgi:hypothetical protein
VLVSPGAGARREKGDVGKEEVDMTSLGDVSGKFLFSQTLNK